MDPSTLAVVALEWLSAAAGAASPAGPAAPRDRPLADAITVDDPSGCIASTAVAESVAAWLGRDTVASCEAIVVTLARSPTNVARFEVTYCDGDVARRTFDPAPSSCADLSAVVGLAIALSLDANALADVVERAPADPPRRDPSPPPPSDSPPPRVAQPSTSAAPTPATRAPPPSSRPSGPELRMFGLARASSGAVPGWAFGGGLGLALAWRPWLVTRFMIVALHRGDVPVGSVVVRATLASIDLDQCVVARVRRFRFGPCAGLAAGPFIAEHRDAPRRHRDVVAWAAATFAFPTEVALTERFGLGAEIGAVVPFVRPRIRAGEPGSEAVRDVSPVGAVFAFYLVGRLLPGK